MFHAALPEWAAALPRVSRAALRVLLAPAAAEAHRAHCAAAYEAVRLVYVDGGVLLGPALDAVADAHEVAADWLGLLCREARDDGARIHEAPGGGELLQTARAELAERAARRAA